MLRLVLWLLAACGPLPVGVQTTATTTECDSEAWHTRVATCRASADCAAELSLLGNTRDGPFSINGDNLSGHTSYYFYELRLDADVRIRFSHPGAAREYVLRMTPAAKDGEIAIAGALEIEGEPARADEKIEGCVFVAGARP